MKVIFLSYDGLLDPLGKSQILPYLYKLRPNVDSMLIISFEKRELIQSENFTNLSKYLSDKNIIWQHQTFTSSGFIFFKIFDVIKFYKAFILNCINFKPTLVHARGHPMAMFANSLKKFFNFKLLFDYRGMWPDEKITKGTWNNSSLLDKMQYKFFKHQESKLLKSSDHIIFLTNKIRNHFKKHYLNIDEYSSVIPCAADYCFFKPSEDLLKKNILLNKLGLKDQLVLGYLGSVGPLYDFEGYLNMIELSYKKGIKLRGLVLTNNLTEAEHQIDKKKILKEKNLIKCLSLSREEIPRHLELFNFLVSFCKISNSIVGASPTKIGESLSLGIPVIANSGIGDTDNIISSTNSGIIIKDTSIKNLDGCLKKIFNFHPEKKVIREKSRRFFDLENAADVYITIYRELNLHN